MSTPSAPAAPNYAAADEAGVEAGIATLPAENQINAAAQLGTSGEVDVPGYGEESYDFTGLGNSALENNEAQTSLQLLDQYGPGLVSEETALTNQADPARAALNQDVETTAQQQLDLGGQLDPSVARQVQQTALGGQAARGDILGDDSAYEESQAIGQAGEQLQQQRTANAQSTLGLAPVTSQFAQTNQATQPLAAAAQDTAGQLSPTAGQQAANFALGEYGDESSNYQNAPANPWMTLAGTAIGAAVGTAAHSV